jgi:hypothetical protein
MSTQDPISSLMQEMSKEEILYRLLKKEQGYYDAILELTESESEILSNKKAPTALTSVIKKKNVLFSCIDEIESAINPLKKLWKSKSKETDPHYLLVKRELHSLDKLLQKIIQMDQSNQKLMRSYLLDLKKKKNDLETKSAPLNR